ncbi:MAG TPA: DUF2844 domain-containing protein [Terriglobales bacterium]|nr:DUF2844 domain-containing protein [Terriglobales bacterium]
MKKIVLSVLKVAALASFILALFTLPVFAALGRDASSVRDDQAHMKGALRVANTTNSYTVHEIQMPSGTVVREFVSPAGKVFGVAWQGPWLPDFRQILGDFFEPAMSSRDNRRGRGPVTVRQSGLVFQSAGHMRAFFGRAYVPSMVPQGVSPDLIQ